MIQPTKNNFSRSENIWRGNMIHRLTALAPIVFTSVALLTSDALLTSPAARAEDVKLPPTMTFTAYDTGTAGFNIAVAVGKMLKDKYSTDVRVLPAGNDVARLAPLRAGRAMSSAMGSGTYFAQEGVFEFGAKEWGPQPVQLVLSSVDCNAGSLGVARDTGVTEIKHLKGKRVGFVVGSPALNQNSLAIMAFGDLKASDVKVVEFSSYGAMWKGLINNDTDAAFATTITGPAKEAETSPRGLIWPPLPHNDNAGWDRVQKVGSFFFRHVATCGAGISKEKPIELGNYPYPIFVVYGSQTPDQVYALTKAMIVGYDAYKDNAPGAPGLAADRQTKKWVVPVHSGAVKALKEAGQWTDDQDAHNNALFKRQAVLTAAWADYGKSSPPSDEKEFLAGWMKARAAALQKASMPNGFEE
jgi:TRAP transporter TAXI family solute receptor